MPAININDLNNAKLDSDTIAGVATSTAVTVTDRLGNSKYTLSGINAAMLASAAATQGSIGYLPPVVYAAGVSLTLAAQTVSYTGQTYAPILSTLPFTTSGTFETAKFRLIQGVAGADLAASGGASLVGYVQAGTGAVARTLQAKERDIVSVKDFGAVGDGVTDDTSKFLLARDAVGIGGKVIVGPAIYLLNNLALSIVNQVWEFDKNATIYTVNSQTTPAITITGDGVTVNGGLFNNQALSTDAFASVGCIKVLANGVTIANGRYKRAVGPCLDCQGTNRLTVRGNLFEDTWYAAVFVKPIGADIAGVAIENNRIVNTAATPSYKYGIDVHNDVASLYKIFNVRVCNNEITFPVTTSGAYPLSIEVYGGPPGTAGVITNVSVTGNVTTGGSIGISLSSITDGTMTGNAVNQSYSIGLEAVAPANVSISGNSVVGPVASGVSVSVAGVGVTVTGNTIRKSSISGVLVSSVGTNIAISGNMISVAGGYGINMQSSKRWAITGNVFEGNGAGLKVVILDKSDQGSITGNVAQNFTQNGVLLYADNAAAYDRISVNGNVFNATPGTLILGTQLSGGATIGHSISYARNFCDVDPTYQRDYLDVLAVRGDFGGPGTPEGVIPAGIGSTYHRYDGGAVTSLYVKESGTGATGWIAK